LIWLLPYREVAKSRNQVPGEIRDCTTVTKEKEEMILASFVDWIHEQTRGQNVLITGASQGLGRAIALRFACEGTAGLSIVARHVDELNKVRERNPSDRTQDRYRRYRSGCEQAARHRADRRDNARAIQGRLDVLVNNASTIGPSPMPNLLDIRPKISAKCSTRIDRAFLLIKNALPAMIECGGSIINVTTTPARLVIPAGEPTAFPKFGLEGMSQTWASELEDSGVRVNWVESWEHEHRDASRGRTG